MSVPLMHCSRYDRNIWHRPRRLSQTAPIEVLYILLQVTFQAFFDKNYGALRSIEASCACSFGYPEHVSSSSWIGRAATRGGSDTHASPDSVHERPDTECHEGKNDKQHYDNDGNDIVLLHCDGCVSAARGQLTCRAGEVSRLSLSGGIGHWAVVAGEVRLATIDICLGIEYMECGHCS
jgi:hypothetical protein